MRHVPERIALPSYIKEGKMSSPQSPEIKSQEEIEKMRPACNLAAFILDLIGCNLKVYFIIECLNYL